MKNSRAIPAASLIFHHIRLLEEKKNTTAHKKTTNYKNIAFSCSCLCSVRIVNTVQSQTVDLFNYKVDTSLFQLIYLYLYRNETKHLNYLLRFYLCVIAYII